MSTSSAAPPAERESLGHYGRLLRGIIHALIVVAAVGTMAMVAVTCLDVVMRIFRLSLRGAYDVVKIAGLITLATTLPYAAAIKGHVAVEFLYHKLGRRGRLVMDWIAQILGMVFFLFLAWQSVRYGLDLKSQGQVTPTLQVPEFWVPWVLALCSGVVVLVMGYQLARPGKVLVKP